MSLVILKRAATRVGAVPTNIAPVVVLTTPQNGQQFTLGQNVTVSGNVVDANASRVEIYRNDTSTLIYSTNLTGSSSYLTIDIPPAAGTVTYIVKGYDSQGLVTTTSRSISVADTPNTNPPPGLPAGSVNVALMSYGGTATASSYNQGPGAGNEGPSAAFNGARRGWTTTSDWWNDATASVYPDWLQRTLSASQSIKGFYVFSVQDNYTNPLEPTDTMTFTQYGLRDFQVQYHNGTSWVDVPGGVVTNNNLVWWKLIVTTPITATQFRLLVNRADTYSRCVEFELWSNGPPNAIPPITALTAPSATQFFASPASVVVSATVTAIGSTATSCQFFQNGAPLGSPDTSSPFSVTAGPLAAGTYTFLARGTDSNGLTSDSATVAITVQDVVATDGNWDARSDPNSTGFKYRVKFDSDADIGPLFSGTSAVQSLTGQYHLPNDRGDRPVFDPVMRAMKFTIPADNIRANAGGAQYTRFPAMSTSGNDSYWFQFRRRGDYNYFNTLYRLSNGEVQLGLKHFTGGPGYTAYTPFGQTSTLGKWVFTNTWGYRFIITYHQGTTGLDTSPPNNLQSAFPTCSYPSFRPGGTPEYPVPMPANNPCFTGAPDRFETILINIATGPKVANPNYPGPSQVVSHVYQNTVIRWWYALPGDTSYTLVNSETFDMNATADDGDHGVFGVPISIGQFYWEVYMTDGGIGLTPPGVAANWWVKEFIVKQLPSSTDPEDAIAIPTDIPDVGTPLNPTWRVGLSLFQEHEINAGMGALQAYDGPAYHPWNTAANNPTNGKQLIYDQDGLNAGWGGCLYYDDENARVYYANASGHSGDRVQKTSVEQLPLGDDTPAWSPPLNPSADFSEAAGIAHGEPGGPFAGVDTCRGAHYDNGDPAGQHQFNQSDVVLPMDEGPRIVIPTNRAATRQTELNHPAPANNAYRVTQRAWFAFGKDLSNVARSCVINSIGGADMSNYSSSAKYPGTKDIYICIPNSNTSYLWKWTEAEDGSGTLTAVSSNSMLVRTEGAGMVIDATRDRAVWSFDYVASTSSRKYMVICENLSNNPTFSSVEITGPGAANVYVPATGANQKMENIQHSLADDRYYILQSVTGALIRVNPNDFTSEYVLTVSALPLNASTNIARHMHYFHRLRALIYIPQFFRGFFCIPTGT